MPEAAHHRGGMLGAVGAVEICPGRSLRDSLSSVGHTLLGLLLRGFTLTTLRSVYNSYAHIHMQVPCDDGGAGDATSSQFPS